MTGPAERYVRAYTLQRQQRDGWTPLEQALVMTLVTWKVDSEMRPTWGEGSDCSDLMDAALARITGLMAGDLTPSDVLDSLDPDAT